MTFHLKFTPTLLPRIRNRIILPNPNLTLPLVNNMLHKHLPRILRLELPDPPRIPEFTCDPQILAAADECVGAAAFCCCWDAVGGEVVLFASSDGDEAVIAD